MASTPPKKPFGVLMRAREPDKITGRTETHQADETKAARELVKAQGMARLHPESNTNQGNLQRAFVANKTHKAYREALKWLKLAATDSRAGRVKAGDRRYVEDAIALEAELRALKRESDTAMETQAKGVPDALYVLLEKVEPLVERLKP